MKPLNSSSSFNLNFHQRGYLSEKFLNALNQDPKLKRKVQMSYDEKIETNFYLLLFEMGFEV